VAQRINRINPDVLLVAVLVSLLEQASPDALRFEEVGAWLQRWNQFSPYLIAPRTDDPAVRNAAVHLRAAGRRLDTLLQPARRGKLRTREAEKIVRDFPDTHTRAQAAANALLAAVT
jgi:hypothetical protein